MPIGNMKFHDAYIHGAFNQRRIQAGGPSPKLNQLSGAKILLLRRLSCGFDMHEPRQTSYSLLQNK